MNRNLHMLNIHIRTIEDNKQRYDTVGDYQTDESGKTDILVSDMQDGRYEFLIALHELIESQLCKERGISDEAIDAFDFSYEENRSPDDQTSEPGNHPDAPYHKEHLIATKIEKMLADELGVDWDAYAAACAALTGKES